MIRRLAVLTLCTALVACGEVTEAPRAADAPPTHVPTTTAPSEPEVLRGVGIVLDDGDGPELCLGGVMESLPPQCGGPALVGWDWAEIPDEHAASGTRWTDGVVVTGRYDGDTFTLTEPAVPLDEYDGPLPSGGADRSLETPCPEPAGGWPTDHPGTMADFEEAAAAAARLEGYADVWVDYLEPPDHSVEGDGYEPDNVVLNVRVVGDREAAASELRKTWPGALCVSTAERTEAELRRIQHEVNEVEGMLGSSAGFDAVDLRVVHDDGSLQERMDERYGEGAVRVASALVPPSTLE